MGVKATIGLFPFHDLQWESEVAMYANSIQVFEQPNVANADFRLLEKHSDSFSIQTEVNVLSENAAWNTLGGYAGLIALGPQRFILDPFDAFAARNFDAINLRLKILSVVGGGTQSPVRRVGHIVGGVNPNGFNVLVTATWNVKWVDTTVLPP